jgi:hypothetical protein
MESIDISFARGVHERMDGHEELEGLDHAFMLDMYDETSYILFTDNDNDKVCHFCFINRTVLSIVCHAGNTRFSGRSNRWNMTKRLLVLALRLYLHIYHFFKIASLAMD